MIPPSQLAIAAGIFGAALGIPMGLYALLTRGQRRSSREIRAGAAGCGWRYRVRHWQGNPTAFRIDGRTRGGLAWILTSGNAGSYDRGWSVRLALRVPALGGEVDLAVLPREAGSGAPLGTGMPPGMESRLAAFSGAMASAAVFLREARELPSGLAAFDAAYQVLALPQQFRQPPLNAALADRMLHWPPDALAPHSVVAWRDPFGFQFQARLPGPPNWSTVAYFLALAEDFCARLPGPATPSAPPTFVDRLVARVLGE
jgi:hypothetical protein